MNLWWEGFSGFFNTKGMGQLCAMCLVAWTFCAVIVATIHAPEWWGFWRKR